MLDDINEDAFDLDEREHVCPDCHTVHWTPTGSAFCQ